VQPLLQWKALVLIILRALVIQHAMRMRNIVTCDLPSSTKCFSTLSHKQHDFRKQLLNMKCVFRFSLGILSETFLISRRN
jgi:hypothetical protein